MTLDSVRATDGDAPALALAVRRCATCHDQCMSATVEAIASGNQAFVVSRVAALIAAVAQDESHWSRELAEHFFYTIDDGAQFDVCIYRGEGHRISGYLRAARREAIDRDLAPASVTSVDDAIAATANPLGVVEHLEPARIEADAQFVLVHDVATRAYTPEAVEAAKDVLTALGTEFVALDVPSFGDIEDELGLAEQALRAASGVVEALEACPNAILVSVDPRFAYSWSHVYPRLGLTAEHSALHFSQWAATALPEAGGLPFETAVLHDSPQLARGLGESAAPRVVLQRCGISLREAMNRGARTRSDGPLPGYPRPDIGLRITRARLSELLAVGADRIVATSPFAVENFRRAGTEVIELTQLVRDAILGV